MADDGSLKKGRPPNWETRTLAKPVTFKIDRETAIALEELVEKQRKFMLPGHSQQNLRSATIRYAILVAAGKIPVS
jgi:hypothetical protein